MNSQRSVLIVDRSEETREVLQTALQRRGVRTLAAGRMQTGLDLARRHQPDLIVLDLELDDVPESFLVEQAFLPDQRQTGKPESPAEPHDQQYQPRLVLLGNLRGWRDRRHQGEFVSKPYHYGPLVRKIEELLGNGEYGSCRRCSSSAEPIRAAASN